METIKSILQKIELLHSSASGIGNIERDLMLQHTRDLYEVLLHLDVQSKSGAENPEEIGEEKIMQTEESAPTILADEEAFAKAQIDSETNTEHEQVNPSTTVLEEIQTNNEMTSQDEESDEFIDERMEAEEEEEQFNEEENDFEDKDDINFKMTLIEMPATEEDEASIKHENFFLEESEPENPPQKSERSITDFKVWNKDIRSYIGINDKYNFISELFGNNAEAYDEILNELNLCESKTEALQFLENSGITTLYQWKEDGFSEQIFYNVLSQFFSSR